MAKTSSWMAKRAFEEVYSDMLLSLEACLDRAIDVEVRQVLLELAEETFQNLNSLPSLVRPEESAKAREFAASAYDMLAQVSILVAEDQEYGPTRAKRLVIAGNHLLDAARLSSDPANNLSIVMALCQQSRQEGDGEGTYLWAGSLISEASANLLMADLGPDPLPWLQSAFGLFERALSEVGPDDRDEIWGQALLNQGLLHQRLANLGEAPHMNRRRAVELPREARKYSKPEHKEWHQALLNEAVALLRLSGNDESISTIELAVALCRQARAEALFEPSFERGWSFLIEAQARQALAEKADDSEANFREAVELCRQAREEGLQPMSDEWARSLIFEGKAQGGLAIAAGDLIGGLNLEFESCERARQEGMVPFSKLWRNTLLTQAYLLGSLADAGDDEVNRRGAAVAITNFVMIDLVPGSTDWLICALRLGLWTESLDRRISLLEESIATVEKLRSVRRGAEDRSEFLERFAQLFALLVLTKFQFGNYEDAWQTAHLAKNRTILESVADILPPPEGNADLRSRYESLVELREAVAADERLAAEDRPPAEARSRRESYARLSQDYRHIHPLTAPMPSLAETFAAVDALGDAVLMELVVTHLGTIVFIRNSGETPNPILLEFADDRWVRELASKHRRLISLIGKKASPESQKMESRTTLLAIHTEIGRLFAAVQEHLPSDGRPLVLSSHGYLPLLPLLAAMWDGQILIERCPVVLLPVPTLAKKIHEQTVKPPVSTARLYAHDGKQSEEKYLPLANAEVEESARLLKARHIDAEVFLDATLESVYAHAFEAGALHLSGHAYFNPSDPEESAFEMGADRLTARAIADGLDLSNCNLVFMSTCDSGAQAARMVDSFAGLAYALFRAGAPTVVAPLWYVADEVASHFAVSFYDAWFDGKTPLFRAFQVAVLSARDFTEKDSQEGEHYPDLWSSWQIIGGWNTFSPSWDL